MEALQQKFAIIYENFGGKRSEAPLLEEASNRLPMITRIKNQFQLLAHVLDNCDDYVVKRNADNRYAVRIPKELCMCFDAKSGTICAFPESQFWRKLMNS